MIQQLLLHKNEILQAVLDSGLLIGISSLASILIGLPLGTLLFTSRRNGLKPQPLLYKILNLYVNVVRSVPFLIFVVAIRPLTVLIMGRFLGTIPATLPLSLVGIAIFSRYVEAALLAIPENTTHTALAMGATLPQIIWHFLYVEAIASLILGFTSSTISIISYSTVMGVVGGGGIGDFAMRYGYQAFNYPLMYTVVLIILALVYLIQIMGAKLASHLDRRT